MPNEGPSTATPGTRIRMRYTEVRAAMNRTWPSSPQAQFAGTSGTEMSPRNSPRALWTQMPVNWWRRRCLPDPPSSHRARRDDSSESAAHRFTAELADGRVLPRSKAAIFGRRCEPHPLASCCRCDKNTTLNTVSRRWIFSEVHAGAGRISIPVSGDKR